MRGRMVIGRATYAALAAAASLAAAPLCALATTIVTSPFRGVTHYERTEPAGAVVPRLVVMHILEIDLTDPGVSFVLTPSNGAAPGEVNAQRTRDFVTQHNAQIGINGDFYSSAGTGPNGEVYRELSHISVAAGQQVSPWSGSGSTREAGINLSSAKVPTLVRPANFSTANYLTNPVLTPYNLIGGNERMIANGTVVATDNTIHPRTCIGYTGNKLYLFTVDGRQTGYSEGMTLVEIIPVPPDEPLYSKGDTAKCRYRLDL